MFHGMMVLCRFLLGNTYTVADVNVTLTWPIDLMAPHVGFSLWQPCESMKACHLSLFPGQESPEQALLEAGDNLLHYSCAAQCRAAEVTDHPNNLRYKVPALQL